MNQIIAPRQSAGTAIPEWLIPRPYSLQSPEELTGEYRRLFVAGEEDTAGTVSPWEPVRRSIPQSAESKEGELALTRLEHVIAPFTQMPFNTGMWEFQWMGSATAWFEVPEELKDEFRRLFAAGKEEFFEDGMESTFSRNLVALIEQHGDIAIEVLKELIVGEQVHPEVASEALRWIGRIEDSFSHLRRRQLLESSLFRSSPQVRDGALLGLASMDDPKAIPSLRDAIDQESIDTLREDIEQVLEQLRVTLGWPPGYFEKTAGCLANDPIERGPQGDYENREEIL